MLQGKIVINNSRMHFDIRILSRIIVKLSLVTDTHPEMVKYLILLKHKDSLSINGIGIIKVDIFSRRSASMG